MREFTAYEREAIDALSEASKELEQAALMVRDGRLSEAMKCHERANQAFKAGTRALKQQWNNRKKAMIHE